MNRNGMMTLLGAVLILGATTATAMPDGYGGSNGMQRMGGPKHMADQLNLTQAQRQQFRQIHRSSRAKLIELRDAEQDDFEALHALKPDSPEYDKETARLAHALGEIRAQKIIQHSRMRARVYAILTPEQRTKANTLRKQHKRRRARPGAMRDRFSH